VPAETRIELLNFDQASHKTDACVTLLNIGNGTLGLIVFAGGNPSATVEPDWTRTLCADKAQSVVVVCRDAPCSFEWRIDQADVIRE
jgi:hypothetical protein